MYQWPVLAMLAGLIGAAQTASSGKGLPDWVATLGVVFGVVGAIAFMAGYGDRKRLQGAIRSYADTSLAYKEQNLQLKETNITLRTELSEAKGANKLLTETVTQAANVEMLAHANSTQHQMILAALGELREAVQKP